MNRALCNVTANVGGRSFRNLQNFECNDSKVCDLDVTADGTSVTFPEGVTYAVVKSSCGCELHVVFANDERTISLKPGQCCSFDPMWVDLTTLKALQITATDGTGKAVLAYSLATEPNITETENAVSD